MNERDVVDADQVEQLAAAIVAGVDLSEEQRRVAAAMLLRQMQPVLMMPASVYAKRDEMIMACRLRFYPERTDHDAANELGSAWRRYASAGWLRDRSAETCPVRIVGTLQGALWEIMRTLPRVLSARSIRRIVGHLK